MIEQIRVLTSENANGKKFDQIRIWVSGIPFQCDANDYTLRIVKRIAEENSIYFIDVRHAFVTG
jgi:hypothetical protein